ncbi:uncharacterized protein LOC121409085 isoform X2 [Lytechinus variegatus]|uniref:uncharacterized protein LOC121409085 isoform X2 n=1 Tax=Lytechinus variegatus TaxID=7654 RepID=UPI001BB24E35|nr:uncharacterized protein LOC121409085 isoform X2 [Lytechinus variegatus]
MMEIPRSRRDNDTTIAIHNAYQLWVEQRDKFGFRLGVLSCENLNEIFALHLLNLHSTCTTCTACAPPATSMISAGHGPEEEATSADGDCVRSRRIESRETLGLKLKVKPPSPPRPSQPALPQLTMFLREDLPISPGDSGENDATNGILGNQPSKGNTDTVHIKQEDLQSSKVAMPKETSVGDTDVAKTQAGKDDWIEENEIEGGCVYDVQIKLKEEVMDDGYQENQATRLQDDDDDDEDIEDDGEDKNKHSSERDVKNDSTQRQLKFSFKVFQEFCSAGDHAIGELSDIDLTILDQLLGKFYAGVKRQSGGSYSNKSMQALRYGLHKYFHDLRGIDIIRGSQFLNSRQVYRAVLQKLRKEGKASVMRHKPVSESDMTKILDSLDLDTPRGLQRKVFVDIMTHFVYRGEENLHDMKARHFVLCRENGHRYLRMVNKATFSDESTFQKRMYEIRGSSRCPVQSFLKLQSKLNQDLPFLWQKPKKFARSHGPWYDGVRQGIHTLRSMTKTISSEAGCSADYTNYSFRVKTNTPYDISLTSKEQATNSGHPSETNNERHGQSTCSNQKIMSQLISNAIVIGLGLPQEPSDHGQ